MNHLMSRFILKKQHKPAIYKNIKFKRNNKKNLSFQGITGIQSNALTCDLTRNDDAQPNQIES